MDIIFLILWYGGFFYLGYTLAGKYEKSRIGWGFLGAIIPLSLLYFWIKKHPKDESIPENRVYLWTTGKLKSAGSTLWSIIVIANLLLIPAAIIYAIVYGIFNPYPDQEEKTEDTNNNQICVQWDQDPRTGGFCTEYEFID